MIEILAGIIVVTLAMVFGAVLLGLLLVLVTKDNLGTSGAATEAHPGLFTAGRRLIRGNHGKLATDLSPEDQLDGGPDTPGTVTGCWATKENRADCGTSATALVRMHRIATDHPRLAR